MQIQYLSFVVQRNYGKDDVLPFVPIGTNLLIFPHFPSIRIKILQNVKFVIFEKN